MRKKTVSGFLFAAPVAWMAGLPLAGHAAVAERIYFVQQDGRHAMVYTTSRTDYSDYRLLLEEVEGRSHEDYLQDYLYLFPEDGDWSKSAKPGFVELKLPGGDFATLQWVSLEAQNRLQVDDDGVYGYRNWDGVTVGADGRIGMWNRPDDFERVAYSWVFPDNLEPVAYEANRPGKWVVRNNAVTYYGTRVNDLAFDIKYRSAMGATYQNMKDLEGDGIQVDQEAGGVKLTLAETLLFPTGVADISDAGKAVLDQLVEKLQQEASLHVVIVGHTDNVPIGGALARKYPTNWELSSARSINIIHYLVAGGVDEQRFESRAFSSMQPVDSNDTDAGRAKNRRIEVLLTEQDAEES